MVEKRTPKKPSTKKSSPKKSITKAVAARRGTSSKKSEEPLSRTARTKEFIKRYKKQIGLGSGVFAAVLASSLLAKKLAAKKKGKPSESQK